MRDDKKTMIDPESALGKALMARNIWYRGDRPGGFIEGWEARDDEVERLRELLRRWLDLLGPELPPGRVRLRDETRLILADALSSGSTGEERG